MAEDEGTTEGTEQQANAEQQQPELPDAVKEVLRKERATAKQAARERDALATRLKEFEDRDKTESQKLADRVNAAERTAADSAAAINRYKVAIAKALPAEQADRLKVLVNRIKGATEEELSADADELIGLMAPVTPASSLAPTFHGGPRPPAPPAADMNALVRAMAGRG